jgi:Glycosyl transferase family 2
VSTTVNVVSYRYGHLVAHAVESVLCQTQLPDVVRVIDDGIGDCAHIATLFPEVELVQRPVRLGQVASFQNALDRTDTTRCLMLGADNWLRPDALEIMNRSREDIVSSDIALFGTEAARFGALIGARQEGSYWVWRFAEGKIEEANYIHGSSLYNVAMAKRIGYRSSGGVNDEEDWMLWRGMLALGATHRHCCDQLLYYRRHRANFNSF